MIRFRTAASMGAAASLLFGCVPALASTATASGAAAATTGYLIVHGARDLRHAGPDAADESLNWSGYIRSGPAGKFTKATAEWTVPTASTAYNGYSSTWVGIDGAASGDNFLIQTGTEVDVVNGTRHYDAWWEVITPKNVAPETRYANLRIHPGDAMSASVVKSTGGKWVLKETDLTDGASGTHTATYAGTGRTAEWIQEDTDVNNKISAAPDWHSVTFHNLTAAGGNADLSAGDSVVIVDSHGTQEDTTSRPNSSNNGFTVKWLAHGAPSPV